MMQKTTLPISVIILTYNEEQNIAACLDSLRDWIDDIIVVDSYSNDQTLEIVRRYTDKIYQNPFIDQAQQFNWALKNADIMHEWVMKLDADERWTAEGFVELRDIIKAGNADGVYVKMRMFFMNRWMKHGDFYPNYFLRVFKRTKGVMEDRRMDEHISVTGRTLLSNIDVIEHNYDRQNNITGWVSKHNSYATREAIAFLESKYDLRKVDSIADMSGNKTERKRWLKEKFYYRSPLFFRPFVYFLYRYVVKLGFLDGKEGFIFLVLQAFWYRFLVDVKIYQMEQIARKENKNIRQVIKEYSGLEV